IIEILSIAFWWHRRLIIPLFWLVAMLYHRDPFDRILVAQAINHSLVLVSRDVAFDAYDLQRIWS
ncbi:hypothetical protein QUA92_12100, partial [Microcoleus sp. F8-C1]